MRYSIELRVVRSCKERYVGRIVSYSRYPIELVVVRRMLGEM